MTYFDPTADERVGRTLKGIDEVVSLQVTGGGQAAVKNGDQSGRRPSSALSFLLQQRSFVQTTFSSSSRLAICTSTIW